MKKNGPTPIDIVAKKNKELSILNKPKLLSKLTRLNHFWLSIIVALSLTLIAFEWRVSSTYVIEDITIGIEEPEMPELIPITIQKRKKLELVDPIEQKIVVSKNFSDFNVVDDYKKMFVESLGKKDDFDPDDFDIYIDEDPDGGDIETAKGLFNLPIESENMLPLFCSCVDLVSKAEKENCNHQKIQKFLHQNLRYPSHEKDLGREGTALVTYIVDKNGNVTQVNVENETGLGFKNEAIRVIKALPCMKPAKQFNQNVAVRYQIPIRFSLKQ